MIFKSKVKNNDEMDENNFLFVRYVYGFKEVPYNIFGLIVNNKIDEKISLYYLDNDKVKEKSISKKKIKEKSYSVRIRSYEYKKTVENNDTKYKVLKEVTVKGSKLADLLSVESFVKLFNKIQKTPAYNANLEFEITMHYRLRGKTHSIVFTSYKDPKKFMDKIKVYEDLEEVKVKKAIKEEKPKKKQNKPIKKQLNFRKKINSKK